jgi:hypothetical protein
MSRAVLSRLERLRTLETEIRAGLEEFFRAGLKLKEIRDDELYKDDGFDTWETYAKERWGWSRDYTYKLIRASEYRAVLPDVDKKSTDGRQGWTESSVRPLTRLEDLQDAAKVAKKVLKAIDESEKQAAKDPEVEPLKLTAATVTKFVNEELGIKPGEAGRQAKAEYKRWWEQGGREESERLKAEAERLAEQLRYEKEHPLLDTHCFELVRKFEEETKRFEEIPGDVWNEWEQANRFLTDRLKAVCKGFLASLERRK